MNLNPIFIPNRFQKDIFNFVSDETKGNLIVEALAGTGKTITIIKALDLIPRNKKVLLLAYNHHIMMDLRAKAPKWVDVRTTHSVGLETIKNFNETEETNHSDDVKYKMNNILKDVIADRNRKYQIANNASEVIDKQLFKKLQFRLVSVINHFRNALLVVNEKELKYVTQKYDLYMPCLPAQTVLELISESLKRDMEDTVNVDFTDMLYLPTAMFMQFNKYDFILVDETQDINESQLRMILMLREPKNGRIIAIGDRKQALYGFRGADNRAMDKVKKATDADQLPLNICYRCPKLHIQLANEFVPEMESAPNAIDGEVYKISGDRMNEIIRPGDIAICRNNAPLIRPALALLKQGIKINIRGQNLKKSLIELIEKTKTNDVKEMVRMLKEYRDTEVKKLKDKNINPLTVIDKVRVIIEFSKDAHNVKEIINYINVLFNDKDAQITFSTVHGAKGTESGNIFFINSFLIPSSYALQEWEIQGEKNIMYVALTRSKNKLYFVDIHSWEPSETTMKRIDHRNIKLKEAIESMGIKTNPDGFIDETPLSEDNFKPKRIIDTQANEPNDDTYKIVVPTINYNPKIDNKLKELKPVYKIETEIDPKKVSL